MTKFYRIETCAGGQRLNCIKTMSQLGDEYKFKMSLDLKKYLDGLNEIDHAQSVKIFMPPLLPKENIARDIIVKKKSDYSFPDVWSLAGVANGVVSEKLKKIIEDIDGDVHQFHACNIVNKKGDAVVDSQHYFMHVRRVVKVEGFSHGVKALPNFQVPIEEREYFTAIEGSQEVKDIVSGLTLWGVHRSYSAFHVSESVMQIFRDNQITGLKNYRKPYGVAGEGVVAYG